MSSTTRDPGAATGPASLPKAAVAVAVAGSGVSTLPIFLVGALALRLRADLDFDEAAFGLASTARFAATAASAVVVGRLTGRIGAGRAIRVGLAVTAASLVGIGLVDRWVLLAPAIALSGVGTAFLMPATDLWLADRVPATKQGVAFGFKQAGQPISILLAGLAVPTVGATVGWRWAFVVAGVLVAALILTVDVRRPGTAAPPTRGRAGDVALRPMLVLATGMAFGSTAVTVVGTFLVSAAVEAGITEGRAGLLLAFGSVLGIAARLVVGHLADRRPGSLLGGAAAMLAAGTIGYVLMATMHPPLLLVAVPLLFAGGWGWTGLFSLAVVRTNPGAPAAAIGITQTGASVGAVAGPSVFGVLATSSYSLAWVVTATASALAAATMLVGRRLVRRDVDRRRAEGALAAAPSRIDGASS